MPKNFTDCIGLLIKDEGGYVNDPSDSGGETKYGISKRAYPNENISALTYVRAMVLYKKDYWDAGKCELLPESIRYIYFDTCVNMGIATAIKILQRTAEIKDDGIFGKQTIAAAQTIKLKDFAIERIKKYDAIIEANQKNLKFRKGWLARVERIVNLK